MTTPDWHHPYVAPDERILWHGKPHPTWRAEPMDVVVLPACLMLLAGLVLTAFRIPPDFNVYWTRVAYTAVAVFALPAVYLLLTTFLHRIWLLRRTAYIITDRRILRQQAGRVDVMLRHCLPAPELTDLHGSRGTIRFGLPRCLIPPEHTLDQPAYLPGSFCLHQIEDASQVMALVTNPPVPLPVPDALPETPLLSLHEGEDLLWQGQAGFSAPGAPMGSLRRFLLVWLMLLVALGSMVMRAAGDERLMPLMLLPALLAIALLLGRPLMERLLPRPVLVITRKRVLLRRFVRVQELDAAACAVLCLHGGRDGQGTLLLGRILSDRISPALEALDGRRRYGDLRMLKLRQVRCLPGAVQAMDAIRCRFPDQT